jgi:hypothetical protein
MKINLFFVIGATNAGKSTFLSDAAYGYGNRIGLVEVGKLMRMKYPPSHFKGQSNPKHTAVEAWQMMVDGVERAKQDMKHLILVDGQPRDIQQTHDIINNYIYHNDDLNCAVIHLYAPLEVRQQRAMERDGSDKEKLELSLARLHNDMAPLYDVLALLHECAPERLITFNTSKTAYRPNQALGSALQWLTERR